MELLIKGGRVVDPANGMDQIADVLVKDGKIAAVGPGLKSDGEIIDAKGLIVSPGFIDMHVHLRDPGLEAKETIATGTRAAAMGGFTGVACMPNTKPVCDNVATVEYIKKRAEETGVVAVYPIGAVTKGSAGTELAEIGDMVEAGAVALSDDGRPVANSETMRRALEYSAMFNVLITSHCEDEALAKGGVMNEGLVSTKLGLKGIPHAAEDVAIARDILLAEQTGTRIHIAHLSTRTGLDLVRWGKARGVRVTCEVTPHHLTLTDEACLGYNTNAKCNPPLRTRADVEALKEGLKDGAIDCIATDHAPHTPTEKAQEFNYAPFGMVGLETAWPLLWKEIIEPGILTVPQLIEKMTLKPAELLHLKGKGSLTVGHDADITLIDPERVETVDVEKFQSKGKNSPFHGWTLKSWPVTTIYKGKVVVKDRKLLV